MTTSAQMSRQRSLEQQRAREAWECVARAKKLGDDPAGKYAALARGAPADIQANGLGQTLAFWRAKGFEQGKPKGGSEHATLYQHVTDWVRGQLRMAERTDLLTWIMESADTNAYRRATTEAIAFLGWVKRFAEAELPSGGDRS